MIRARVLPAALFAVSFAVFLTSPNHRMTDSGYALLVSENLLRHADLDLGRYQLEGARSANYRLTHVGPHVYYFFPVATSILSVPYVAGARLLGRPIVSPDGQYVTGAEEANEACLAALLMAAYAVIVLGTARLILSLGWSLTVAAVTVFGTQIYSAASRTLWSDDWALVLLGAAVYLLARAATRSETTRPVWLGTLAAWAYFVRPTNGIALVGIALYLWFTDRSACRRFLVTAGIWLAAFVIDSVIRFGAALPPYFRDRLGVPTPEALAGTLVSPSRGLLVCVPATLAVVAVALRYRSGLRYPPLVRLATGICLAHWLTISSADQWWGGHCFGARLATGMIPWLALVAILAVDGACRARAATTRAPRGATALAVMALLLSVMSVSINAAGAISARTFDWNLVPSNVALYPARLWSWRHAQVWSAFRSG
jgi:hypothetical protein